MNNKFLKGLLAGVAFSVSGFANAGLIVSGSIGNIDGDVDGLKDDLSISQVIFEVTAGTQLLIDSLVLESTGVDLNGDGEITGFDNYMLLLAGSTLLTSNDDAALGTDGSVHPFDSQISYTFATAGTYMATVGQLSYNIQDALQGFTANRTYTDYASANKGYGAWQLTFNVLSGTVSNIKNVNGTASVPAPSTLAVFALGLFGLVCRKFKR